MNYTKVKEIICAIEDLGYVVKLHNGTEIYELYKSIATGKILHYCIAMSTKSFDKELLEKTYEWIKKRNTE